MALWLEWQIKVYVLMVLLCVGAWTSAATPPNSTLAVFERWMARHGRIYMDNLEKAKRYEIFLKKLRFIEDFNSKAANRSYTVGLNQFSDLTTEEFRARYNGFRPTPRSLNSSAATTFNYQNVTQAQDSINSIPDSISWVDKGLVGSIKQQGLCGSCWAFSTIATVETLLAIKGGRMVDLSEQQLIDCNTDNGGCKSGSEIEAFRYMERAGIASEEKYPYKGVKGECNGRATFFPEATIQGYYAIPVSEHYIEMAVAAQPVTAGVDSDTDEFRNYKGGIFTGPCGQNTDHSVAIVGYGRSNSEHLDYWLIKNSWSEDWGEKGYMRIQRRSGIREGVCGINLETAYAIMYY
ncbi:hypothetical protein BT93_L3897 [Corymbia citriodora subsp. variegata]|uniref:Uncharacterized protein n=1 Tax=Corymbia citriodora subsp. variegata TaxID=360336 RepID=A0A8T0CHL7_CORYI|nr:hypothetical protein BT93_L3897 [Corymbia citriodora subsp. variegata]